MNKELTAIMPPSDLSTYSTNTSLEDITGCVYAHGSTQPSTRIKARAHATQTLGDKHIIIWDSCIIKTNIVKIKMST